MSTLPISLGEFKMNPFTVAEKLQVKKVDILSLVQTEEEIRERVKGIFNDIIVERAQKLIIFIDELIAADHLCHRNVGENQTLF